MIPEDSAVSRGQQDDATDHKNVAAKWYCLIISSSASANLQNSFSTVHPRLQHGGIVCIKRANNMHQNHATLTASFTSRQLHREWQLLGSWLFQCWGHITLGPVHFYPGTRQSVWVYGWLRSTAVDCWSLTSDLPCPALDLRLTHDHLCG